MRNGNKDSGFSIVALMVGIAVLMILLGAAMPVWHTVVQRDREEELIFRGEQYVDAIIRFYGKNNRYPLTLDELAELDGQRFVRKLWTDPMMEDGRWILIFAAHNGPPKTNSQVGGAIGANPLGAGGPGVTAPRGGDRSVEDIFNEGSRSADDVFGGDPFGGGQGGDDLFGGGQGGDDLFGGGQGGDDLFGGGQGGDDLFGGGQGGNDPFGGGQGGGGGGLQGPGAGGLASPGGQTFTRTTFLHGTNPGTGFGSAASLGLATPFDNRQTDQAGRGSPQGGGGFSGGGGGLGGGQGGFSGGGGGLGGGQGGFGGGGGGLGGGQGGFGGGDFGGGAGRPGDNNTGLDDVFGQSDDLFDNEDGMMLSPFEGLQGTEDEIVLNARPIIGVRSRNSDESIREYNGQSTYDQWVFKVEQMPERRGGGRAGGGQRTRTPANPSGGPDGASRPPFNTSPVDPGNPNNRGGKTEGKGPGGGRAGGERRQLPGGGQFGGGGGGGGGAGGFGGGGSLP